MGSQIATPELIEALVKNLVDENNDVRQSTIEALGCMGSQAATVAVVEGLINNLNHQYYKIHEGAVEALNRISSQTGIPAIIVESLTKNLDHESSEVRKSAAEALGYMGIQATNSVTIGALIKNLVHQDYVRYSAAWALASLAAYLPKLVQAWLQEKADNLALTGLVRITLLAFLAGNACFQVLWDAQSSTYYWQVYLYQQHFQHLLTLHQAQLLRVLVPIILDQYIATGKVEEEQLLKKVSVLPLAEQATTTLPEYISHISPQEQPSLKNVLAFLQTYGSLNLQHQRKEITITWHTSLGETTVLKQLKELHHHLETLKSWEKMNDCDQINNQLIIEFKTTAHARYFIEEWQSALSKVSISPT